MLAAVLTFVAVFLVIASVGVLLMPRESAKNRIAEVIEPALAAGLVARFGG